jgi:hypothetical protein
MSRIPRATPSAALMLAAALWVAAGSPAGAAPDPAKVCASALSGGFSARALPDSLPAAERARFGVLRRPATPADALTHLAVGEAVASIVGDHLATYDPSEVRMVGPGLYLVAGHGRGLHLSAACRRVLPAGGAAFLADQLGPAGTAPTFCIVGVAAHSPSTASCSAFSRIAGGFEFDAGPAPHELLGLVPDGVGAVSIKPKGNRPAAVVAVAENVFAAPWPMAGHNLTHAEARSAARLRLLLDRAVPLTVTWLAAPGGAVVRTFARPPHLLDDDVAQALAGSRILAGLG